MVIRKEATLICHAGAKLNPDLQKISEDRPKNILRAEMSGCCVKRDVEKVVADVCLCEVLGGAEGKAGGWLSV